MNQSNVSLLLVGIYFEVYSGWCKRNVGAGSGDWCSGPVRVRARVAPEAVRVSVQTDGATTSGSRIRSGLNHLPIGWSLRW